MRQGRLRLVVLAVAILVGSGGVASVNAAAAPAGPATPAVGGNIGFNPNLMGRVSRSAIPSNPPVESWRLTAHGFAVPLGTFDYVSNLTVHFGVDGKPLSITDGVGAFTGESRDNQGDAIFFTLSGIFRPTNDGKFDAVFIVNGGTGRYAGLFGSGRIAATANLDSGTFVGAWDGTVKFPGA